MKKLSVFCLVVILQTLTCVDAYAEKNCKDEPCTWDECVNYQQIAKSSCYCANRGEYIERSDRKLSCSYIGLDPNDVKGTYDESTGECNIDEPNTVCEEYVKDGNLGWYKRCVITFTPCTGKEYGYKCKPEYGTNSHLSDVSVCIATGEYFATWKTKHVSKWSENEYTRCDASYYLDKGVCKKCPLLYNDDSQSYDITSTLSDEGFGDCFFEYDQTYEDDRGMYTIVGSSGGICSVTDVATGVDDPNLVW